MQVLQLRAPGRPSSTSSSVLQCALGPSCGFEASREGCPLCLILTRARGLQKVSV